MEAQQQDREENSKSSKQHLDSPNNLRILMESAPITRQVSGIILQIKIWANHNTVFFLSSLEGDQRDRLTKRMYKLICFLGVIGYVLFSLLVYSTWLFVDFIVAIFKFQRKALYKQNDNSLANEGTHFAIGLIITILIQIKALAGYLIRLIGWGDFDYSNSGILKTVKAVFKEARPSQTTFRFGVLSIIIIGYFSAVNVINLSLNAKSNRSSMQDDSAYIEKVKPESSPGAKSEVVRHSHQITTLDPKIVGIPGIAPLPHAPTNATIKGDPGAKNIRSGPGTIYSKKRVAYPGERVKILGYAKDREGYLWYKIYFPNIPKPNDEGWIAAQLLSPD
jgi:hypothetical protein